jgi:hypothetical protein
MFVVIAAFVGSFLAGCGTSALPPPVTVTYRPSLVGIGLVVQISNDSGHHLYNVRVVGRNFEEVASASVKAADHLGPGEVIEVGWMEFESWVPVPGETIEVYADNYLTPKLSVVPNAK